MDLITLRKAAIACGHAEPISIEPDGTIWLGIDSDRQYLSKTQQQAVVDKAKETNAAVAAARASANEKLHALGLTAEEIAALLS